MMNEDPTRRSITPRGKPTHPQASEQDLMITTHSMLKHVFSSSNKDNVCPSSCQGYTFPQQRRTLKCLVICKQSNHNETTTC
jgi:hypothetical protein